MRNLLLLILVACAAGCLRKTEYVCTTNEQCTGNGGVCEATGYCSFADTACAMGQRYSDNSGIYSGQCVGDVPMDDAGVDSDMDGPPAGCPANYMTLPNAGSHVYRLTNGSAQWTTQRDRCAADNAYLAIPDDAAELMAITTKAGAARTWIGINDIQTEGTYVTVKGPVATFVPWDTANGEPDNPASMGGEDCVSALMATPNIATDRCTITFPAVCECEP
jgi:hypothetical protein